VDLAKRALSIFRRRRVDLARRAPSALDFPPQARRLISSSGLAKRAPASPAALVSAARSRVLRPRACRLRLGLNQSLSFFLSRAESFSLILDSIGP
jgi:hypothetical protein